jgi:hypothetical protein
MAAASSFQAPSSSVETCLSSSVRAGNGTHPSPSRLLEVVVLRRHQCGEDSWRPRHFTLHDDPNLARQDAVDILGAGRARELRAPLAPALALKSAIGASSNGPTLKGLRYTYRAYQP